MKSCPPGTALPDSSAWIDFLRGRPGSGAEGVSRLLVSKKAVLCNLVRAELLPFMPRAGPFAAGALDLGMLPVLPDPPDLWERVMDFQRVLIRKGSMGVIPDLIIVAVCSHHDVPVLSVDGDFRRHARFLPLKLWNPGDLPVP